MTMDEGKGAGFLFGLLVGALLGASVAMLLAPQSGEETREMLREKADVARRKAMEIADNFKDDAEEWVEKGKKYIEDTKAQITEKMHGKEEGENVESPTMPATPPLSTTP